MSLTTDLDFEGPADRGYVVWCWLQGNKIFDGEGAGIYMYLKATGLITDNEIFKHKLVCNALVRAYTRVRTMGGVAGVGVRELSASPMFSSRHGNELADANLSQ